MTHRVQIVLVAFAPTLNPPKDFRILLVGERSELPNFFLREKEFCQGVADALLQKYTAIKPTWIQPRQIGVFDNTEKGIVSIGYGCIIPETTKLHEDARWVSLDEVKDNEIVRYIVPRL